MKIKETIKLRQFQNQESGDFMYLDEETKLFTEGSLEDEMWKHTRTITTRVLKIEGIKDEEEK